MEAKINIFYVDHSPIEAAKMLGDKHVVSQIKESAQLLSTTHRLYRGIMHFEKSITKTGRIRYNKRFLLPDKEEDNLLPKATHIKHPCLVWTSETDKNYEWLFAHFVSLLVEYNNRYNKIHAYDALVPILKNAPRISNIPFVEPPLVMPPEFQVFNNFEIDTVESYRNYYKNAKSKMHVWTNATKPSWISS